MKLPTLTLTFLTIFCLSITGTASAGDTIKTDKPKTTDGRYGRSDEGWFFYRDPPKQEEPKPETPQQAKTAKKPEGPKVLSAEWLRENLPKYRNIAIDNPTKDNMELYLLLQKLTMDKAEQFALASRSIAQQNPGIDETVQNPISGLSRRAVSAEQDAQQDAAIKLVAKRAGIYYFFRSDCPYCHKQNPMIDILERMTGMAVIPISLDGLPSQDGMLPDWRPDRGQGAYLGVEKTPTMYLVEPGGKVQLLSVGVRALPELRQRIIELANDSKWITKEQYDLAMRGLPRKFLTDELSSDELSDDPQKLLSVLRDASMYGGKTEGNLGEMDGAEASAWNGKRTRK